MEFKKHGVLESFVICHLSKRQGRKKWNINIGASNLVAHMSFYKLDDADFPSK
jgi:hypothetical protein